DTLTTVLRSSLTDGGCALVIRNTVRRVQEAAAHLRPALAEAGIEVTVAHSRFLAPDRAEKDRWLRDAFGSPDHLSAVGGQRPHRHVLVASQVAEQSLDLDFDLMVTDLAPADLVLQRAGRLHRHRRDPRPRGLAVPRLWICRPEHITEGVPVFDHGTTAVYDAHALLRSWLVLRERDAIAIPDEIPDLIEAVYDDRPCPATEPPTVRAAWEETRQRYEELAEKDAAEAAVRWIKRPGAGGFLWQMTSNARA